MRGDKTLYPFKILPCPNSDLFWPAFIYVVCYHNTPIKRTPQTINKNSTHKKDMQIIFTHQFQWLS